MVNNSKMHLIICVLVLLCAACKKNPIITEEPAVDIPATTPPVPSNPKPDPDPTPNPALINIEVGTGSGSLTIDGATLNILPNTLVKIKSGNYNTITIRNITATVDKPVYVKNDGQVNISGSMQTNNISNVVIAGDNTSGITYGINFENISYRAIRFDGKMNNVTLKNMRFKNVGDYVMSAQSSGVQYTGSADTRTDGFKILYCMFDNAGTISMGGNYYKDSGEDTGLFKDVEIAYNTFQNSDWGSMCSFTNTQDYNIHHNVVNNVNPTANQHNGVFFMQGNGKFHHNKLTNYQGNSIRMWVYSRGTTPSTVEIYENICYNTRKYSGFELQAFDRNINPGKTTYVNAKVYNNTVGKMNISKDWEGQILDLYNTGGSLEYYNNLGFDLISGKTIENMINNMSDTKIIVNSNNKYVPQQSNAVNDTNNFTSKFPGVGASGI
ncbi:hypothetical protein [Pedobacter hiemivivus]|uniref:Right-handed parallel beta-helix repeat-containing protein n=1 Tax=Pedobacter hiemivivus TaxID=2530454 RepID=A0A4R0NAV2_9SPHI|nr:hypothetical protein [Pedobacter hiemivivus]TCC97275.1 hypothetical protein EZ444_10520 [Pedobacter hiemivivus]